MAAVHAHEQLVRPLLARVGLMRDRLPPTLILLWVEISHAMQWFVSWGIFTWVGKVSYGFYLMQFLTIYGLMPHLVLYFDAQGRSYWDNIVPTYIICLLFNLTLAWCVFSYRAKQV